MYRRDAVASMTGSKLPAGVRVAVWGRCVLENQRTTVAGWPPTPKTVGTCLSRKTGSHSLQSKPRCWGKGRELPFPQTPYPALSFSSLSGSELGAVSMRITRVGSKIKGKNWSLTKFLIGTG